MRTVFIIFLLLSVAVIDCRTLRIPDPILIVLFLGAVLFDLVGNNFFPIIHLFAAIVVFTLFFAVFYFSGGLGFGDVKFAAVLAYILGPGKALFAFLLASFCAILFFLPGMIFLHWAKDTKVPFAPFLSLGAIVALTIQIDFSGFFT